MVPGGPRGHCSRPEHPGRATTPWPPCAPDASSLSKALALLHRPRSACLPRLRPEATRDTQPLASRARLVRRRDGAGLRLSRSCQPMGAWPPFRSASRPIRASRCHLRLHSALFADAGSLGASAAGETRRFLFFSFFFSFFFFNPPYFLSFFFSPSSSHAFTSGSGAAPDARGRRMFDLRISEAPPCIHSRLHRRPQPRPGRRLGSGRRQ